MQKLNIELIFLTRINVHFFRNTYTFEAYLNNKFNPLIRKKIMKKVILSGIMAVVLVASSSVMAQDVKSVKSEVKKEASAVKSEAKKEASTAKKDLKKGVKDAKETAKEKTTKSN